MPHQNTIEIRIQQSSDRWRVLIIVHTEDKATVYRNSVRYSGKDKAENEATRIQRALNSPF